MPVEHNSQYPPLEAMVFKLWKNQERQRRWRWIKRTMWFVILGLGFYSWSYMKQKITVAQSPIHTIGMATKPHVAVIDLKGIILESTGLHRTGTSDNVIKKLQYAFKNSNLTSVVLRVDSPGGEPVSAEIIYSAIKNYRKQYPTIPIIAVCEGMCASAAYYIASACNEIYVHPASVVGSIGVRGSNSMGFVEFLKKVGAERRILTAGQYANFLDPFLPLAPEELKIEKSMLNEAHRLFIDVVKSGRGSRLQDIEKNAGMLFSGQVWTGRQALALGLVDGFHTVDSLIRDLLKAQAVVYYVDKPDFMIAMRRLVPFFQEQFKMLLYNNTNMAFLAKLDPTKSY